MRCDFLPESYMASTAIRERRRTLRYRSLVVRQMVQMKIKISALLMEAGVSYNKQRPHSSLRYRTPKEFAQRAESSYGKDACQRKASLENAEERVYHFPTAAAATLGDGVEPSCRIIR